MYNIKNNKLLAIVFTLLKIIEIQTAQDWKRTEGCVIKRRYTLLSIAIVSVLCFICIIFYLFSINRIGDIYISTTNEMIYSTKKDFLKNTVDNLISEIDLKRKRKTELFEKVVNQTYEMMQLKIYLTDSEFNEFVTNFFQNHPDYGFMTILVWNHTGNYAVYDSKNSAKNSWEDTLRSVSDDLCAYRTLSSEHETILLGVSKEYMDSLVKEEIADIIRNAKFDGGSYIWVNEIINYEGGTNYAIRRVHPNLLKTEGMYLSTNIRDIKGNLPYLEELEGVKKDGELFITYYFKEMDSAIISEKLAYAKLYKDYNWIIAMGVYLDDLQAVIDHTNEESKALASKITRILLLLFMIILILSYALIVLVEKLYYRHSKKMMEYEMNQDTLTKAENRRGGKAELTNALMQYRQDGAYFGIVMLDIDLFKNINDNYGHDAGDFVLIEIVKNIKCMIGESDHIIRWGGDEFILILKDLKEAQLIALCERILLSIADLKIQIQNKQVVVTLSMGISFFREDDLDFIEALERADKALYMSKTNGRNQISVVK
ncbi:diguanylate cyclase domain-containing protein [Sinanaerobacter sp. ZZT-01]|uniref:diguanylate cyclase domain-containing protein n=1 Tax=Sinanaerobacter sp. ZZT-01 TaxID=3111540 RepID=UPI002D785C04|nr:diguanylate cyclase [Sinanaerobacter sp. ZZT-01]WRR93660.1 diguanylate cyclase [Sinanaerobacter sp. ZZT-01]